MTFVTVKTVKGLFNEVQKKEIFDGITALISNIAAHESEQFKSSIWVAIEELEPGNWSFGEESPTAEERLFYNLHHEEGS